MAICYLCKGKEVVQVQNDTVGGTWPCPKCRIQEFHIRHEVSDAEMQSYQGSEQELDRYMRHATKCNFVTQLLDAFEIYVEIDAKNKKRTYRMDLWVVLPKTKGG